MGIREVRDEVRAAADLLIEVADPEEGDIFVLGASTSEIQGKNIGSAGDEGVAAAVFDIVYEVTRRRKLHLAVQCCEHLNRCLVVPLEAVRQFNLARVTVIPTAGAGGAVASRAMECMRDVAVVERVQGHLGMDIGDTFIGMHLRPVVVPVRMRTDSVGRAHLTMARTRPPLVGGYRAQYPPDPHGKKVRNTSPR
ncbi:MAG: TIGR01440 family protein [Bacillota bacterium]